ncbi:MAG: hypothetical protein ACYCZF_12615 [Anaerolineae bacterium]
MLVLTAVLHEYALPGREILTRLGRAFAFALLAERINAPLTGWRTHLPDGLRNGLARVGPVVFILSVLQHGLYATVVWVN